MRGCNYDVYRDLLKTCNPDKRLEWVKEDVIKPLCDFYDKETCEEVKDWYNCTVSFLRRYMKFASGCMTDAELNRFYNDILKMLDKGIESRKRQKILVEEELQRAKEEFEEGYIDEDKFEEIKWQVKAIKKALDNDVKELENLKSFCVKAKDKFDVVMCIEKVANMAHDRGSMLPVMCGAYLPEDVVDTVTETEVMEPAPRPADVGLVLSNEVVDVFDCIKEFGRKKD